MKRHKPYEFNAIYFAENEVTMIGISIDRVYKLKEIKL